MSSDTVPNNLVLYHYSFSPYARRVVWYLTLRKIPYAQCLVPSVMPREVLQHLNVAYRRIPLVSHGRDFYCDTRLILEYLETQFHPSAEHPNIAAETPEGKALSKLLIRYHNDAGLFANAAGLIPNNAPVLNDPKWINDRQDLGMRNLDKVSRDRARPECLANIRDLFLLLENILLADGRNWVLGGEGPGLADIEAVWLVHWLMSMPGALDGPLTEENFPKTYAYSRRFDTEMRRQMKQRGKPITLKDDEKTADTVRQLPLLAHVREGVDDSDPTGLKMGETVEIFPIDSGAKHRDKGELVRLQPDEIVVKKWTKGSDVRVHVPRWGFKVRKANAAPSL